MWRCKVGARRYFNTRDSDPNGHTSTRHVTRSIALRKDDEIRIEAAADGGERAAIDYLEISAVKN